MSLDPIFSWSLQSPDATNWAPQLINIDVQTIWVIWVSGGGVITATPPVFQSLADPTLIYTPSISNAGVLSMTSGTATTQRWAAGTDDFGIRYYFVVNSDGLLVFSPLQAFHLDEVAVYSTLTPTQISAHYAARLDGTYITAVTDDDPIGYWRLGESPFSTPFDPWPQRPIVVEINGVSWREYARVDSLNIDDTLGQQVTAYLTIVNAPSAPQVGSPIRIFWYSYLLFAGTIDAVTRTFNKTYTVFEYACQCVDYSQILFRRKIQRNFSDVTIQSLVDSLLDNELSGEGLSPGIIDARPSLPLVDAQQGRVYDILRDAGGATGQTFYVGFDKKLEFRSSTVESGPSAVATATCEEIDVVEDRENYWNRMTVIVEGTRGEDEETASATVTRSNDSQIAARAAIEGGSGVYEDIEKVTHPTSNLSGDLTLLGIGVARLRLANAGAIRRTVSCRLRGWGFRAGQIIDVNIPQVGAVGEHMIQRASLIEQDGNKLVYDLELVISSRQRRAYESWLNVVSSGKVTVLMPGSLTSQSQLFITPGVHVFVVPDGVMALEITCVGASAGGSGSAQIFYGAIASDLVPGGAGGNGGLAVSSIDVVPGSIVTLTIGAAGLEGANSTAGFPFGTEVTIGPVTGTSGAAPSGPTFATYNGIVVCQADPGQVGTPGSITVQANPFQGIYQQSPIPGLNGPHGAGNGDAWTVGGGQIGGNGGNGAVIPLRGSDGRVEVRW